MRRAQQAHTTVRACWCALAALACERPQPATVRLPEQAPVRQLVDPPVVINSQSPVEYPPVLYTRGIEGRVVLRLYVDASGRLVPDSTLLAESSGFPAFDSAALGAVGQFRFAPALHNGTAVATLFLLPIDFRHPQAGGTTP